MAKNSFLGHFVSVYFTLCLTTTTARRNKKIILKFKDMTPNESKNIFDSFQTWESKLVQKYVGLISDLGEQNCANESKLDKNLPK